MRLHMYVLDVCQHSMPRKINVSAVNKTWKFYAGCGSFSIGFSYLDHIDFSKKTSTTLRFVGPKNKIIQLVLKWHLPTLSALGIHVPNSCLFVYIQDLNIVPNLLTDQLD